jgi:hypothetical protein
MRIDFTTRAQLIARGLIKPRPAAREVSEQRRVDVPTLTLDPRAKEQALRDEQSNTA